MTARAWLKIIAVWVIGLGASYFMATLGEPKSVWLWGLG